MPVCVLTHTVVRTEECPDISQFSLCSVPAQPGSRPVTTHQPAWQTEVVVTTGPSRPGGNVKISLLTAVTPTLWRTSENMSKITSSGQLNYNREWLQIEMFLTRVLLCHKHSSRHQKPPYYCDFGENAWKQLLCHEDNAKCTKCTGKGEFYLPELCLHDIRNLASERSEPGVALVH